jgi:phenylalanyl-tRNA synthetase beta chain
MLASHAWLEELTGLRLDPKEVAARLTAAGIEVEAMTPVGQGLQRVIVAEVRSMRPHPKRDKLQLVTVFDGQAEQEIVCGASNVPAPGGRVVLATLGAKLPFGLEIAERELAGVVSRGMLCSERELDIGTAESGILVLDSSTRAEPGEAVSAALGLSDTIYELGLTPNRPDCLGHLGLARELCALFEAPFTPPQPRPVSRCLAPPSELWPQREAAFELGLGAASSNPSAPGVQPVRVEIADGARCPRYGAALVVDTRIGSSPFWLRYRLHRLGLRAISNVVDATNYVLMLFGHPIHAFDYAKVRGSRIRVRLAGDGERIRTIDGQERVLCADDLLICDGEGPVALAGVMGGQDSEIGENTQRVLIECAYFDPRSIRRTSKRTGLHTDSSHRFERGVDSGQVRAVLAYAASLIAELASGAVIAEGLDLVASPLPASSIALRMARVQALLGKRFEPSIVEKLLRRLGCVSVANAESLQVEAPTHRPDLTREIDLIEEVARVSGYDTLPTALPSLAPSKEGTHAVIGFVRRLREAAAAAGFDEAINYAFLAPAQLRAARAPSQALRIVNPMSEERSVMRTALLPGLLANLRQAQNQQQKRFACFELARVFEPKPSQALPEERHQLGLLCWGQRRDWYEEGEAFDFYDAKAAVEAVIRPFCGRLPDLMVDDLLVRDAPELHPKRCARIHLGGRVIGIMGELHPEIVSAFELEGRPVWAVLEVGALAEAIASFGPPRVAELPRFPSAARDIAVVVKEAQAAGEVATALRDAGGPHVEAVTLFDIYRGEPVPAGAKSLAFHMVYRDAGATLTDKVVDALHAKVVRAAEERFGGSVRR